MFEVDECKGFLITCDQNKQKQALRDAYNFLSQYVDQVYQDLVAQTIMKTLKNQNKQITLQTELQENKKKQNRLFFSIDTKVKCLVFVKINPKFKQIDPVLIVMKIMQDIYHRKKDVTRFCHKILPVQKAFKAQHFKMLQQVDELLEQKYTKQVKSWALNFKCRNNSKFNYKQILKECEGLAAKYGHFVDIYYPQWTLSIQIVHHLMCISLTENYKQFNQYKLHKKIPLQPRQKRQFYNQKQQVSLKQDKKQNNTKEIKLLQSLQQKSQQKSQQFSNKESAKIILQSEKICLAQQDDVDLI